MNTTVEQPAPVEFRMTGRTLTGTAIRYSERAQDRAEMFLPGSFISGLATAALNLQHDREHVIAEQPDALAFTNSVRSLALKAQLRPDSAEARLVARGALKGLSVEFVAIEERQDSGLRVISKTHLAGVGLVDSGSYRTEVQIRQRMAGAWFRATIPTETTMQCRCQGPTCTDVTFDQGAFDDVGKGGGRWADSPTSSDRSSGEPCLCVKPRRACKLGSPTGKQTPPGGSRNPQV